MGVIAEFSAREAPDQVAPHLRRVAEEWRGATGR